MTTPEPNVPQQPPAQGGPPAQPPAQAGSLPTENPGKTLGIVGLILAFLGPAALVGLILSIVGLRKSKKAGHTNGVALAGIIVSSVTLVLVAVASVIIGISVAYVFQACNDLGPGTHFVDGVTYTCDF